MSCSRSNTIVQSKMSKILQILPILLVLNYLPQSWGRREHGLNQDAYLWPGVSGKGIHVRFTDGPAEWSDLYALVASKGFYTIGKFCVQGTFILYESPLFEVKTPNAFQIISGRGTCMVISEATKSIQLVGSMGYARTPSITFFEKPNFGSQAYPMIINAGSSFFRKMEQTSSMIIIGRVPWTIQLKNGTRFCLKPHFDHMERSPICMVRDLGNLIGTSEVTDMDNPEQQLVRATQGCRRDISEELVFRIQDCLYWGKTNHTGNQNLIGPRSDDMEGRTLSAEGLCGGNEERAKTIFSLYKAAITHNFEFPMFIGMHKLGKNGWKLDILDYTFTIVEEIVTSDLIPLSFLNKVREFFVSKLAKVWETNPEDKFSLADREYSTLIRLTKYCKRKPDWTTEFRRAWSDIETSEQLNDNIAEVFRYNPSRNIIVEFVWLAGHMVGNLCHLDYAFKIPFWSLYFRTFWEFYWNPIVPEWAIPQGAVELIFGGVDHILEYNKFALFTTMVQQSIGLLEPFERPQQLKTLRESKN